MELKIATNAVSVEMHMILLKVLMAKCIARSALINFLLVVRNVVVGCGKTVMLNARSVPLIRW
jgi:hypothetical protein